VFPFGDRDGQATGVASAHPGGAMRRWFTIVVQLLAVIAIAVALWSLRWRYDSLTVQGDRYVVRIHRVTGHADILVPEMGWVPAEERWEDAQEPAPGSPS
jgi:hypothetical protein